MMIELPIVIVNVQRGGPSTGMPTKTEQSDLLQAMYGRNGESAIIVIAASTPSNCFDYAFDKLLEPLSWLHHLLQCIDNVQQASLPYF